MKKIRAFIVFILIPFIAGYFIASGQGHKSRGADNLNFIPHNILSTDRITLSEKGTIITVTQQKVTAIPTNHPALIEVTPFADNYIGIDKQTDYSSIIEFSPDGTLLKTLFNGNTGNIDTMNWYTDPSVNNRSEIAFVSDKDKEKTNVLDNALFVANQITGSVKKIADPYPHSGGIAHPIWDPADPNSIAYDYYEYDNHDTPYSVIDEYNKQTKATTQLTTKEQNAYQGSFSPDGKQFVFLGRDSDFTVSMHLATIDANGLSNIQNIATGNFAYPAFSNMPNHIYYLQAQGNAGYDLYTATVQKGKLTNVQAISTGEQLQADSGFALSKR